uniref:40S ribosomal protein S12 n=1 Tax=Cyprinus carpio carpio TaxID=630221 RepID=A0A8C1H8Z9_CYPCA
MMNFESLVGYPFTLIMSETSSLKSRRLLNACDSLHLTLYTLITSFCTINSITAGGVMDVNTALPEVLKTALIHDGLARGIREAAKALDKRQAHLCVLAANCDEPMYVKLVEALCAEHQINLIKVDDNKKLGEWVGLCKIDREGKPRKVVGCSCVVIKDYGKESQAKDIIEEYFKSKK